MSPQSAQSLSSFVDPSKNIQPVFEMDLGSLTDLPVSLEDLFALSLRMEAFFNTLWPCLLELIPADDEEIARKVINEVFSDLALDFVERYGVLALLSTTVLRLFWEAQRRNASRGPERLRQLGERLAIFALAGKGSARKKTIDIAFRLGKPAFLEELERVALELGTMSPGDSWADRMLEVIRLGDYTMLKQNLTSLEAFFRNRDINLDLKGPNAIAADLLAADGTTKTSGNLGGLR